MTVSADALRQIHRIHRQLTDLQGRLDRGPKQVQAASSNLTRLKSTVDQAKEALTRTRVHADDKQLQLRQREDRIKDLQLKLNSCNSNREYQALTEQIAADEQANSVLSDEILEALEKIDEQLELLAQTEQSLNTANQEFEKLQKRVETERAGLESELERVQTELVDTEAALPADFRTDYQRITRARGEECSPKSTVTLVGPASRLSRIKRSTNYECRNRYSARAAAPFSTCPKIVHRHDEFWSCVSL